MNIDVFCYDDVKNPNCGGGGAYRELEVHRLIAKKHNVYFYTGKFKSAAPFDEGNFHSRHLGCGTTYLISRVSFSIAATIRSFFSKADIIALPYSIYSPVLTFLFKPKKTVIMFFHITGKEVFSKYSVFGIFPWIAEKLVLNNAKHYITLTDSMAADFKKRRPEINVTAGYVSFDTSLLSKSIADESFIFCFGRIDIHMKGLDILVPAFEKIAGKFPDQRLVIAGRGKESDIKRLNQKISESPYKDRIQILINIPDTEKKRLFHGATFVCMPSRFEGWNIAAMEAAASSKATIGTRIHGLTDAIRENETGFLVEPENVSALADKMEALLRDPLLRKKFGENGYVWAQNFSLERIMAIQEKFYLKVANADLNKHIFKFDCF